MPTIVIRPTDKSVRMDGVMVRVWEGWTDIDQPCLIYTLAVIPEDPKDMESMKKHFGLSEVKRTVKKKVKR
jgi:hypothetical protein